MSPENKRSDRSGVRKRSWSLLESDQPIEIATPVRAALVSEMLDDLETAWPRWGDARRRKALAAYAAWRFRNRFGFAWRPEWVRWTKAPPWARVGKTRGRSRSSRAALVMHLDWQDVMGLGAAAREPGPRGTGGTFAGARFLSVVEYTWISILVGNWPTVPRSAGPRAVLAAEGVAMKQAIKRYGQQMPEWICEAEGRKIHIRRGKQGRTPY